jgi:SAM-dependent methyltransferase
MAARDILVFDRKAVRAHRRRADARFGEHDFLFREVADRLADRLLDISRHFPDAVEIGDRGGILRRALRSSGAEAARGIGRYLVIGEDVSSAGPAATVLADPEAMPLAAESADLVVSNLALHWVNDLPGALVQMRRALRPDGLLLAAMLGGQTLVELREAFLMAEAEIEGGVSPRVSPFADVRDIGGLLQRAGFALPVTDLDVITVSYADPFALLRELRGMGETNATRERRRTFSRRQTLLRAAELYRSRHAGADGRVGATFEVIFLAGWAPHESQQQPLRPGSATTRLAEALGTVERLAGDKARPR